MMESVQTRNKLFLILFITIISIICTYAVPNRPPSIYIEANKDVYFKPSETCQLQCVGDGYPKVIYKWKKNGIDFNPSGNDAGMVMLPNSGTLVINNPEDKFEGIYQCFAENDFGTSMTNHFNLREAKLATFPEGKDEVKTVQWGDSLTIVCVAPQSFPPAEVKWVRKDSTGKNYPINFDNRITMDLESRLHFVNVKKEDQSNGKVYACMVTNYFMRQNEYDKGYELIVIGASPVKRPPEYMWSTPSDTFALVGQPFTMKCIFSGSPTPEVYWERNDNVGIRPGIKTSLGGQQLFFPEVQEADAGVYECYGTNTQGLRANRVIRLRVESKPSWVLKPKSIETSENASATFLCEAQGTPAPKCNWFINSDPIDESKHPTVRSNRFLKPDEKNVTVVDLTLKDVFVIQCNCSNIHGSVFADVYLNVLKEAPQFIKMPTDVKAAEGQNITMFCETSGKPDPIITWYKEGQQITGGRYQTLLNGNLFIESMVLSDAGQYHCTAANIFGSVAASGSLTVRRKTRIESMPGDLEVNAGIDAKFTCTGTTDFNEVLNLGLYWEKDGKRITTNDEKMTQNFQDNSLTISGTISRDSGFYTCVVTDGLSTTRASAILTVKDRPDKPVDVKIVTDRCRQEDVEITWTKGASNNAPVQYFVVEYSTLYEPDKWVFASRVISTSNLAKIPLQPYNTYYFRVLSVNKIGQSDPSNPTTEACTTNKLTPRKNPENIRTIGDMENKLVIEWTPMPPIQHGGDKFEYILNVRRNGIVIANPNINNWNISRYEVDVTGQVFQPYNITLQAKNSIGTSNAPANPSVGYSYESIPQVPVTKLEARATSSTTAMFNWEWDPKYNDVYVGTPMNGVFRGFKIQFWRRGSKPETFREVEVLRNNMKILTGNTLVHNVTNLPPFTDIEAQIVVMNTFYVSKPSPLVSFTTKEGVPGPVKSFTAIVVGSNFVKLQWQLPDNEDRNGRIIGFDIGYQIISQLDIGKMQERDPQIYDYTVTDSVLNGLTSNQRYRIHIWARTINGRGEDYFIEIVTSSTSGSETPTFDIKNVNSTFFNVTWNLELFKTAYTVVYVEFRKEGAADWMQSTDEVANTWKGVPDLESGTSYEVRLAVTDGDSHMASDVQYVKTNGIASAYNLGGNFGWFIGMMLAVLILVLFGVLIYLLWKRGKDSEEAENYRSKKPMYPRSRREPQGETNDYYKQSFDDIHGSRQSVENKTYGKEGYDDYDDYDRKYDDREYYGDDYDNRYDDYDHDYDHRYDDYDKEHNDHDEKRYSDYDRNDDDYNHDYDRNSGYSDEKPAAGSNGASNIDEHPYEPYERRVGRATSRDSRKRVSDMGEEEYRREPGSKFDDDGYPVDSKVPGASSTFV